MAIVYLDFRKRFDTAYHNTLTKKMMKCRLDKQLEKWIENWLNNWSQRTVISGTNSSWRIISFLNESRMRTVWFLKESNIFVTFTESYTVTNLWRHSAKEWLFRKECSGVRKVHSWLLPMLDTL